MCGLAGQVVFQGTADHGLVRRMTAALTHRGPDDAGHYRGGVCALGHRRLAIVDRSGGRQPLANEDGSVWVAYNGEIYNHAGLRDDLIARGHRFRTRADTEVLVHAYEEHGLALPERLRGMFAFALWDAPRRRLVLVRDRLGIKPLYYALAPGRITFASELRALLLDPTLERRIDPAALTLYLALRYVPGPATLISGVRKLQPGTLLVWEHGEVKIERYWDLAALPLCPDRVPSEVDAALALRETIDESVKLRLMSEVPLGAFLSGGIDSTLVTASMQATRGPGAPLKTFAVGYRDETQTSELGWARQAAAHLGTEHRELVLDARAAAQALPDIVWALDEPIADPAAVPLYFLARRARDEVTVVLSGEGSDELFAGYAIQRWMIHLETLYQLGLGKLLGGVGSFLPWQRLRRAARGSAQPLEARYRGVSRAFDLVDPGECRVVAEHLAPVWHRSRGMSPLERVLHFDTTVWLPDDLLMKADKMTMAFGLELRVPLLDHRLVEFAWTLPDHYKVRDREGKYLLRRAARGRVPPAILTRPKAGFSTPTSRWLRRELSSFTTDVLLDRQSLVRERFERRQLTRLLAEHRLGRDRTPELWSLLVLELWHRHALSVVPHVEMPERLGEEAFGL